MNPLAGEGTPRLVKKSFYLYEEQVRALARVLYHRYLTTGKRMTESELVREALDRYLREVDPGGRHPG